MPYGPKGEWRPADPIAAAITTGEIEETYEAPPAKPRDPAQARRTASAGGKARAASLTPERRHEILPADVRERLVGIEGHLSIPSQPSAG